MTEKNIVPDLGQMLARISREEDDESPEAAGIRQANELLVQIAERACELHDEVLLTALEKLGYVYDGRPVPTTEIVVRWLRGQD